MPSIGARTVASVLLFSSAAICASTAATRARAPSISSRRAPALSLATPSRAAPARARAESHAISRHISSRGGIVSLLLRTGVALQQLLEALEVLLRGRELGLGRGHFARRRHGLRLRLPDVFRPRSRLQEPKLRVGGLRDRPARAAGRYRRRAYRAARSHRPFSRDCLR